MKLHFLTNKHYCYEGDEDILDLIDFSRRRKMYLADGSQIIEPWTDEYDDEIHNFDGNSDMIPYLYKPITEEAARTINLVPLGLLSRVLEFDLTFDPAIYPCELFFELGANAEDRMWLTNHTLHVRSGNMQHAYEYENSELSFDDLTIELQHRDHRDEVLKLAQRLHMDNCEELTIIVPKNVLLPSGASDFVLELLRCLDNDQYFSYINLQGCFAMSKQFNKKLQKYLD